MEQILAGNATDAQIAALLSGLRNKGETLDEIVGFATAMRRHATPIFPARARTRGRSARGYVRDGRRCIRHF